MRKPVLIPLVVFVILLAVTIALYLNWHTQSEREARAATPSARPEIGDARAPQYEARVLPTPDPVRDALGYNAAAQAPPPLPPVPPADRVTPDYPAQVRAELPPADVQMAPVRELAERKGTPERDMALLMGIMQGYLARFEAYPAGDNRQVTNALTGNNPDHEIFIPKDHPAINKAGEIEDRWGSPLFFHMIARDQIEVRSAGPDKALYTGDDLLEKSPVLMNPDPALKVEL